LEAKGFVTRQPDPHDRRAHRVLLTGRAREIGPAIEQVYNQVYTLALQGITQEELDCFFNLFGRISENFMGMQAKKNVEDHRAA
jgi:DNA-binding MarR family transcriptional regulator